MKMLLEIPETKISFFEELISSFSYVHVLKIIKDHEKGKQVFDLAEAFNEVKLHEQGKKKLKNAKEFFDEL
jgi:hypothetical protein